MHNPSELPSRPPLQHYVAVLLLLLALPAVYFSQLQQLLPTLLPGAAHPVALPQFTYIADLDFWQRTERETQVLATAHFDLAHDLNTVPLIVGDWRGIDVPETNEEVMILLDPEQYIQRLYQNGAGEYIWLSMIGGRSSQPFHAPDICYDADGWQYNLGSYGVELNEGGKLYGLWLDANKTVPTVGSENATEQPATATTQEHIVFYFYLFPSDARQLSDGIVLFKLTSGRHGTVDETLALHADFIRQFFTAGQARFSSPT